MYIPLHGDFYYMYIISYILYKVFGNHILLHVPIFVLFIINSTFLMIYAHLCIVK